MNMLTYIYVMSVRRTAAVYFFGSSDGSRHVCDHADRELLDFWN